MLSRCGSRGSARRSSPRCRRWPLATGSVNLGQGFPDTDGPAEVAEAAVDAHPGRRTTSTRPARASPSCGRRSPRTSSASTASTLDPDTEVLVTAGATEAIAAALLALVDPGDEVVAFEPYYDSYAACIAMAGGVRRAGDPAGAGLPARPRRSCAPRSPTATRLILLNTPAQPDRHGADPRPSSPRSPTLAVEHDLLVVTDEVYEHLVVRRRARARSPRCPACASAR